MKSDMQGPASRSGRRFASPHRGLPLTYHDLPADVQADYADLDDISKAAALIQDSNGVLRFRGNAAVQWIFDQERRPSLNDLWRVRCIPDEDLRSLYRLMGYSLCGFLEIFHA